MIKVWDRAIYSTSDVLREISVCNLLHHPTGKPEYLIMYPVRDIKFSGSSGSAYDQQPAKYTSTEHSSPSFGSGWKITPLSFVLRNYQAIRIIACSWLRICFFFNVCIGDWPLKSLDLYFVVDNQSYPLPFGDSNHISLVDPSNIYEARVFWRE